MTFVPVHGIEVEASAGPPHGRVAEDLVRLAADRWPAVPTHGGFFLANGGRLYVDSDHVEWATPESFDPSTCIRHVLAGEEMLRRLAGDLQRSTGHAPDVFCGNVGYAVPPVTCGLHENYFHRVPDEVVRRHLEAHIVSRVCFGGAGGFDPFAWGVEFSLSPRCNFIADPQQRSRDIFLSRREPLLTGARLQVTAADHLRSHWGAWLRLATTSLIVWAIESDIDVSDGLSLASPYRALHRLIRDPRLERTVSLRDGREISAVDIQRAYLATIEANLGRSDVPDWAPLTCERWAWTLDRLASRGPAGMDRTLDWPIKLALFRGHADRRRFVPDEIDRWNLALRELRDELPREDPMADWRRPIEVLRERPRRVNHALHRHELDPGRFEDFMRLRAELFELDVRFSQVAPHDLFADLEPYLDHRIPEVDAIDRAVTEPPATGRAAVRGRLVRECAGRTGARADWCFVDDGTRRMSLNSPYATGGRWTRSPKRRRIDWPAETLPGGDPLVLFERGWYRAMRACGDGDDLGLSGLRACAAGRLGWANRGLALLREHGRLGSLEHLEILRFEGLAPSDPRIVALADHLGESIENDCLASWTATYLAYKAGALLHMGRAEAALATVRELRRVDTDSILLPTRCAEALTIIADVLRHVGRTDEAHRWLGRASVVHARHRLAGDFADRLLTVRAKLLARHDRRRALRDLASAATVQRRLMLPVGLTRTLLLEARLLRMPNAIRRRTSRLRRYQGCTADLGRCPRLAYIFRHWEAWVDGAPAPDPVLARDDFWFI